MRDEVRPEREMAFSLALPPRRRAVIELLDHPEKRSW
jgi:hypothetical protein